MPSRILIARELADIFKVLSHPDRIRLIEELGEDEKDVKTIADELDLPGARISQHLSLLRAHRFVEERREGRHHFYRLSQPALAPWIIEGLGFLEGRGNAVDSAEIRAARRLWKGGERSRASGRS